ncbi:MAG: nitroreductase family protein [Candidatus Cryosericum sp.]
MDYEQEETAMLKDLVLKNRSYRRFYEDVTVDEQTLRNLVDLARFTASSANKQPLRYILSWTPEKNDLVFSTLKWASYLEDWDGPAAGERPSAYIVILADKEISTNFSVDAGIAAQTILLGAVEQGLGGCMLSSVNRPNLKRALDIVDKYEVALVLALGQAREKVTIEPVAPDGNIKYWRDAEGTHHVPKRSLDDLIVGGGPLPTP